MPPPFQPSPHACPLYRKLNRRLRLPSPGPKSTVKFVSKGSRWGLSKAGFAGRGGAIGGLALRLLLTSVHHAVIAASCLFRQASIGSLVLTITAIHSGTSPAGVNFTVTLLEGVTKAKV